MVGHQPLAKHAPRGSIRQLPRGRLIKGLEIKGHPFVLNPHVCGDYVEDRFLAPVGAKLLDCSPNGPTNQRGGGVGDYRTGRSIAHGALGDGCLVLHSRNGVFQECGGSLVDRFAGHIRVGHFSAPIQDNRNIALWGTKDKPLSLLFFGSALVGPGARAHRTGARQGWLGRQSAAFQDDVLGRTRGLLFRKGGLRLDRFVNRAGDELPRPTSASSTTLVEESTP